MIAARIAYIAFLALILPVAALVFAQSTWAASGNVQVCQPNTSCTVGEFLYNDSYVPITTATCTITSRYPNGTLLLNAVSMPASSEGDGWYAHTFTTPTTLGLYRTEVKCTVGSDTMALDKSFEVQTAASTLTSNDVASAVWGYSSRSLTTFGTLVSDIWNHATRTVTGFDSGSFATQTDVSSVKTEVTDVKSKADDIKSVADKIKELIDQLKPTNTTTNITNISNISQEIKNINEENRLLLEKIINRPVIEGAFEYNFTLEFQGKVDETQKNTNRLLTQTRYLKSKTSVIDHKWRSLSESQIVDRLSKLATLTESISEDIDKVKTSWNWQVADNTLKQARAVNSKILVLERKISSSGKSASMQQEIKSLYREVAKLEISIEKNLLAQIDKVNRQASILDKNIAGADRILSNWNHLDLKEASSKVVSLAKEVSAINMIPKINNLLVINQYKNYSEKELKNKVLGIKGVLSANKKFLAATPGQPLNQLWLEEGSIVFKTLVSNPSSRISQEVPVKYYLPAEVKRENIVSIDDGLTINFDAEKDRYYVSGKFKLASGESKTISVTVDDNVFHIPDEEIASIRKQVEELSKPLENTAYFAQGTLLKSDINASLDKVENLQKDGLTPEAKIRAYREAYIEYKAAKEKLEKLKEIATSAGSVGTLFGFVGGAQALAVWGLIIIMVAGFVFLALYMRALRGSEKYSIPNKLSPIDDSFENYEEIPNEEKSSQNLPRKRFPFRRPIKYLAVILVSVLIGGSSIYALATLRQGQIKHQVTQTPSQDTSDVDQAVLGSSYKEVNILVPDESTVTIHTEPTINSLVLISLNASKKAKEISREGFWVKVILQNQDGKNIEGWVDGDFVEEIEKKPLPQGGIAENPKMVIISDTPTGFLRVRKTPGGEEITKINPGEQYNMVKEQTGWVQIVLEDGTSGWVSKQYVSF